MEAYQLKKATKIQDLALQAWFNQVVQSVDNPKSKNPKPKYKKFKDFYDLEGEIDEVRLQFEDGYKPRSKSTVRRKKQEVAKERFNMIIARINEEEVKGGLNGGNI